MYEPFNYVKDVFGGTEYMGRGWHQHIADSVPKFKDYLSIIIPGVVPPPAILYSTDKKIICWMHNTPQQFDPDKLRILQNPKFLERIKYFVVPSEEHKKLTLQEITIDPDLIKVIPNAIEPLRYDYNKFEHPKVVKLIHTSSPDRGLDVLLNAVSLIQEDFRLEIYNKFNPDTDPRLPKFDRRIKFYGFTPKDTVREAYENSHIHAYPSTYPETFCISQIEAMSAGLLCVTSDLGAIPEVSGGYTTMYPYVEDRMKHAEVFAEHLTKAIQTVKKQNWFPQEQIKYVNSEFSWAKAKERWVELHESL